MLGTLLNVGGILVGGFAGLFWRKSLTPAIEARLKIFLAAFTVFFGLRLTWISFSGSFWQIARQFLILLFALSLGKILGHLLGLQVLSNRMGRRAREYISAAKPGKPGLAGAGFKTCAILFCASPLGILGSIQDGLTQYFYPLSIKAVVDGLASFGFVSLFGWGCVLSALPVLAFQGTLTLVCARMLEPFLASHGLVNSVNAVGGMLVFSVALVMLGLKRIELADYLPSLVIAPLLSAAWQ
jgi:uncharacterized membrane protein YqgA involved in biofilm formation